MPRLTMPTPKPPAAMQRLAASMQRTPVKQPQVRPAIEDPIKQQENRNQLRGAVRTGIKAMSELLTPRGPDAQNEKRARQDWRKITRLALQINQLAKTLGKEISISLTDARQMGMDRLNQLSQQMQQQVNQMKQTEQPAPQPVGQSSLDPNDPVNIQNAAWASNIVMLNVIEQGEENEMILEDAVELAAETQQEDNTEDALVATAVASQANTELTMGGNASPEEKQSTFGETFKAGAEAVKEHAVVSFAMRELGVDLAASAAAASAAPAA